MVHGSDWIIKGQERSHLNPTTGNKIDRDNPPIQSQGLHHEPLFYNSFNAAKNMNPALNVKYEVP